LQKKLSEADVIITDRLVNPDIISRYARKDAVVLQAGKQGYNDASVSQEQINTLIVEHALNGNLFSAELHIVHKSADGTLAVVGILFEEGAQNEAFQPFVDNLPAEKSDVKDAGVKINAADLLPAVQTTYRYSGSLTTPPCSEGVHWNLMTTPVELSSEQLNALETLFEEGNNRPVQPLNDRPLAEDGTP
jgi:carbonic anhydrase